MNRKLAIRGRTRVRGYFRHSMRFVQVLQVTLNILVTSEAAAITKTAISSGDWNNASCWSPAGKPDVNDDVNISANNTITLKNSEQIKNITIATYGKLIAASNKTLTISGGISVNGTLEITGGNINLQNYGSAFNIGPKGILSWSPGTNSFSGATLFTNGIENFDPASTLIIKKWYDYSVPLGEVVNGNFGNVEINSPGGTNSIVEWNQKNKFESHLIKGTLTIDLGWITLDKTGSITSTQIGNIVLKSINSTFIAHSGNHPSSFTVTTGSVSNNDGNFYGLNDGNGNIILKVSGDFNNSGNIKIINNTGISGVANGNATIRVDGNFNQSAGDTRIIYNVTTTNSGTFNATFKNLNLSGGIFMGQNAIHTGGHLNLLNILQDMTVNFSKATDKFRGSALTSIGNKINNAGIAINIGRDLSINGVSQAEFTSSASAGDELVSVHHDMTVNGCNNTFNFGTPDAAHSSEFYVQGNLSILGGTTTLSKNNGKFHSEISNDMIIKNGDLILKGNSGATTLDVKGRFSQEGGNLFFHSNKNEAGKDIIKVQVNGTFKQSGGTINFDDNASGVENILSLKGDSCLLSGDGKMIHAGGTNICGQINFDKEGTIIYKRGGYDHLIDKVNQTVATKCDLVLNHENIKIATHSAPEIYEFKILNGGKLTLNNSTLSANLLYSYCNIRIDSGATVSLTNEDGLYGKNKSAFKSGINYYLDKESVVEYNGDKSQSISGYSSSNVLPENKYGILKINSINTKYSAKLENNVYIRKELNLENGKIDPNNHTITLENGEAEAINRLNGYIESDPDKSSKNLFCWKNMKHGIHEFPFGKSSTNYLPVIFNLKTGSGNVVSISTCRTDKNNESNSSIIGLASADVSTIRNKTVDRCWSVDAPGVNADIIFSYGLDENILSEKSGKTTSSVLAWNGSMWTSIIPGAMTTNKHRSTVSLNNVANANKFLIVSNKEKNQFELKVFDATQVENEVLLSWETENESTELVYKIEKSTDGNNYYEIGTLENNSSIENFTTYNFSDKEFNGEVTYYRLKYINENNPVYSNVKIVSGSNRYVSNPVKIIAVSPNPFRSAVKVQFKAIDDSAIIEINDASGRIILSIPAESVYIEQGYSILNLESLKKGIYFLSIINKGKKDTVKIIKNE